MAGEVSFDVVSEFDEQELRNALDQVRREIQQRFDFKGVTVELTQAKEELTLVTGQAVLSFCQFFCSLLDEAGLTLPVEDGFGRGALALRVRQCPPSARSAGEEQPRGGSTGEGGKGRRRRRESRLESDGNKENSEARKGSGRKVARKKRTGLVERDGLE